MKPGLRGPPCGCVFACRQAARHDPDGHLKAIPLIDIDLNRLAIGVEQLLPARSVCDAGSLATCARKIIELTDQLATAAFI